MSQSWGSESEGRKVRTPWKKTFYTEPPLHTFTGGLKGVGTCLFSSVFQSTNCKWECNMGDGQMCPVAFQMPQKFTPIQPFMQIYDNNDKELPIKQQKILGARFSVGRSHAIWNFPFPMPWSIIAKFLQNEIALGYFQFDTCPGKGIYSPNQGPPGGFCFGGYA